MGSPLAPSPATSQLSVTPNMAREKDVYFAKLAEQAERYDEWPATWSRLVKQVQNFPPKSGTCYPLRTRMQSAVVAPLGVSSRVSSRRKKRRGTRRMPNK